MKKLKFSVITVSYNQGEFIKQTIDSVLAQKYDNFEHIVIDGGSTDNTLEILRSYPHLKWITEKDRGQSHALNKGFSMATGDVIAWINSDDWYPEGVFETVNNEIQNCPIVIGKCQVCNKQGEIQETLINSSRNWFDILKYWIFESIPSQPSLFFKRELLQDIEKVCGNFIDESLEYCMDYEFWLRLCKNQPLMKHIDQVLSYIRIYDTNKTGEHMDVTYQEIKGVFKRHASKVINRECDMSFLIPLRNVDEHVFDSIQSIIQFTEEKSIEILLIDHSENKSNTKQIRNLRNQLAKQILNISIKYLRVDATNLIEAFVKGAYYACSNICVPISSGQILNQNFLKNVTRGYSQDNIALHMFMESDLQLIKRMTVQKEDELFFKTESVFSHHSVFNPCAFSKLALIDLANLFNWDKEISEILFFRQYLIGLIYKGWTVSFSLEKCFEKIPQFSDIDNSKIEIFNNHLNAYTIDQIHRDYEFTQFAKQRAKHGFSVVFPEKLILAIQQVLKWAPLNWFKLENYDNYTQLIELERKRPNFSPTLYYLSESEKMRGNSLKADEYYRNYINQRNIESGI